VARLSGKSYEQMRVILLEFLDTDVFNVSVENCVSFLDPLIESWDIDLVTFAMEIVLNRRLVPGHPRKFEFVEKEADQPSEDLPGFKRFLRDPSLSGEANEEELEFLKRLRFNGKQPTPLYYYRELQNLRDPLHFQALMTLTPRQKTPDQSQPEGSVAPMRKYQPANGIPKQLHLHGSKTATRHWAGNKGSRGNKQKAKS
jgi:hypothetical protein